MALPIQKQKLPRGTFNPKSDERYKTAWGDKIKTQEDIQGFLNSVVFHAPKEFLTTKMLSIKRELPNGKVVSESTIIKPDDKIILPNIALDVSTFCEGGKQPPVKSLDNCRTTVMKGKTTDGQAFNIGLFLFNTVADDVFFGAASSRAAVYLGNCEFGVTDKTAFNQPAFRYSGDTLPMVVKRLQGGFTHVEMDNGEFHFKPNGHHHLSMSAKVKDKNVLTNFYFAGTWIDGS